MEPQDTGLIITVIGAVASIIGALVAIFQARKAWKYKQQIAYYHRKVRLSEVANRLWRALDAGRNLVTPITQLKRGKDEALILRDIQTSIDEALILIPLVGSDASVRDKIVDAQEALRAYQDETLDDTEHRIRITRFHVEIQEAISTCQGRIRQLEAESR